MRKKKPPLLAGLLLVPKSVNRQSNAINVYRGSSPAQPFAPSHDLPGPFIHTSRNVMNLLAVTPANTFFTVMSICVRAPLCLPPFAMPSTVMLLLLPKLKLDILYAAFGGAVFSRINSVSPAWLVIAALRSAPAVTTVMVQTSNESAMTHIRPRNSACARARPTAKADIACSDRAPSRVSLPTPTNLELFDSGCVGIPT